jgi:glycogen synthase
MHGVRVLYVTPTFPPENGWGGVGTYVHHMVRGMKEIGCEPIVLCGVGPSGKQTITRTPEGVQVLRVLTTQEPRGVREQVFAHVSQLYRDGTFDVVEFPEYAAPGLMFQRAFEGCPAVVRLHGDSQLCARGNTPPLKRFAKALVRLARSSVGRELGMAEKESVSLAHAVTAPTNWTVQQAARRGWIPSIRSGIVVANPFSGFENNKSPRKIESANSIGPAVTFLGRLDYLKGAPLIPNIIKLVHAKSPATHFKIIGQSGYKAGAFWRPDNDTKLYSEWIRDNLSAASNSLVEIVPGVPYAEVPNHLPINSIACFQSTWETFGYTHVEAMYCGLATVIASRGGARELGDHNVHLVYSQRTAAGLAAAITNLLSNPALRQRLGEAGRQHIASNYSSRQIALKMMRIYGQAVSKF